MLKRFNPHSKIIITDVDGCLLDWEWSFQVWMQEHGFELLPNSKLSYSIEDRFGIPTDQGMKWVKQFNESAAIGFLPPLRDAMYYVKRLFEEHGYEFHCITSVGSDPNVHKLREMNLQKLFGASTITRLVCLDLGASKEDILAEYKGSGYYFIEDKESNAEAGLDVGLKSILMEHGFNMRYQCTRPLPVVKNWKEIYELIVGK